MYLAEGRLPQPLRPPAYFDPALARREDAALLRGVWRFVGAQSELRPAVVRVLSGAEVEVRREGGEVRAAERLGRPLPVARCGQLVFVALEDDPPPLEAFLGDLYATCLERFGADWGLSLKRDFDYPANWKIPTENSLEAYHVAAVHPGTFGGGPDEAAARHYLLPHRVELATELDFDPRNRLARLYQALEQGVLAATGGGARTGLYRNILLFPNLMFAFTDTLSLAHAVEPLAPGSSYGLVRQFSRRGRGPLGALAGRAWGALNDAVTTRIMREDISVFAAVQQGLEVSRHPGMLGRNEERVHHFQSWIAARTAPA